MGMRVVGIDYSTVAVDAAMIPIDGSGTAVVARTRVDAVWKPRETALRARMVGVAAQRTMTALASAAEEDGDRIELVVLEEPMARIPAVAALMGPLYGAVSMAVGGGDVVLMSLSAVEWRGAVKAPTRAPREVGVGESRSRAQALRRAWLKDRSLARAHELLGGMTLADDNAAEAVLIAYAGRLIGAHGVR